MSKKDSRHHGGKGWRKRIPVVSPETFTENWERVFGKQTVKSKTPSQNDVDGETEEKME